MSGFDNEVLVCSGGRLEVSSAQSIGIMQGSGTVSLVNYVGNPEGNVSANASSLSHNTSTGQVYVKQTGTGNTGWIPLNGVFPYTKSVDFTVGGLTALFTTANRPFIIVGYTYYGTNINTPTGDGFANYGWTAPDYDDEANGANIGLVNATGQVVATIPADFSPALIVPALTTFYINITTPETAVAYIVDVSFLGFYV